MLCYHNIEAVPHRGKSSWEALHCLMPLTWNTLRHTHAASYQCLGDYDFLDLLVQLEHDCTHTHNSSTAQTHLWEDLLKGGYFYFWNPCTSLQALSRKADRCGGHRARGYLSPLNLSFGRSMVNAWERKWTGLTGHAGLILQDHHDRKSFYIRFRISF